MRGKIGADALGNQGDGQRFGDRQPFKKFGDRLPGQRFGDRLPFFANCAKNGVWPRGMGAGAAGAGGRPAAGAGAEHAKEAGSAELFAAMGEIDHNGRQGGAPGTDGSGKSDAGGESERETERGVSAEGFGIRADAEDRGKRRRG